MNWTHFLLWLSGGYGLYYLIVILSDLAHTQRQTAAGGTTDELIFSESVTPVQLAAQQAEPAKSPLENEMLGSGGVPITDLFRLARQEAIIYTRSVSF